MFLALADRSGNATAQQVVGFMYSTGLGDVVERDEAKAMIYTTFAAMGHNTAAELTLGYKYMLGIGTKKSCQDSVEYYTRAADKGTCPTIVPWQHKTMDQTVGLTLPFFPPSQLVSLCKVH
jgi:hypothetical protein